MSQHSSNSNRPPLPAVRWHDPATWPSLFRRPERTWSLACVACLALVGGLVAIQGRAIPRYAVDQVLPRAVIARADFRATDAQRTHEGRERARRQVPSVYVHHPGLVQAVRDRLVNQMGTLGANPAIATVPPDSRIAELDNVALHRLRAFFAEPRPSPTWEQLCEDFLDKLARVPVVDDDRARKERGELPLSVALRGPSGQEIRESKEILIGVGDPPAVLQQRLAPLLDAFPIELRRAVQAAVTAQRLQPTYVYDEETTEARREQAAREEPVVEKTYAASSPVIRAGAKLTETELELMDREREAYSKALGPWKRLLHHFSVLGVASLIAAGLWAYLWHYNRRIAQIPTRGLALALLLLLGQLAAIGFTAVDPRFLVATVAFPTLFTAIVLAIAYDQRFAMVAGAAQALLVALSLDLTTGMAMMLLTGVTVAAAQLDQVRTRSKLLHAGFWSGLAMAVAAIVGGLFDRWLVLPGQLELVRNDGVLAALTGLGTGLVVQGALPAIESVFRVTTALTLKELNDASHPLLRRLAQEAPGTYQHSLRLADMAEAAADAIGASSLLCKVGAMYHDIGKIHKPDYFIENQGQGPNRHAALPPNTSLLIIVGHVKDGLEMAREYSLPPVLRHFIESHHGTTLVEFFYHAAVQQSDAAHAPAPPELQYRYPGPKPQTREAAILMLGDSVESAARTLDAYTPQRIEQLVHAIASKRLSDGQLDECNLTLQELHTIERSLARTVEAMYHGRVKYPSTADLAQGQAAADAPLAARA